MFRPLALVLTVVLAGPVLAAPSAKLAGDPDYQAGLNAMQDHLPDLAIPRFEKARATFKDDPEASRILALEIGEAAVRAARRETERSKATARAEAALKEFSVDALQDDENALFWSGQAMLVLGRFGEAEGYFSRLAAARDPALRDRSQLTRVHLLAAMGRHREAHEFLGNLVKSKNDTTASEARLLQGSLLLAQGKLDQVAQLFPDGVVPSDKTLQQHQAYLLARLAQARGEHENAAALFRPLAENREGLGASIQHGAVVGLAESIRASPTGQNQNEKAIDVLINLIDKNPHTPMLESALVRILAWSSGSETLKNRVEERLRAWANAPSVAEFKETPATESPNPKAVLPQEEAERAGYALFYYARYLAEKNEPDSNELAARLLSDLRTGYPTHPMVPASLLETAWLQSAANRNAEAIATLMALEESTGSAALQAEAATLAARLAFKGSDFAASADAFNRARKLLVPGTGEIAALNAGIALLRAGNRTEFGKLLGTIDTNETLQSLQLEQALYLVSQGEGDARPILDRFLRENPSHPRAPEAQLAYAAELLRLDPDNPLAQKQARARLDELNPAQLSDDAAALRHFLANLTLAHLTGTKSDWNTAIKHGEHFLENRKAGDLDPAIRLKLAEAYYMNGNLATAHFAFETIAEEVKEGALHEVALFFAAKAALKLGTANSIEEARNLFNRVIAAGGTTADEARLLLARSLIAANPSDALVTLKPLLGDGDHNANQVQALILAAEANRAMGEEANYREAIKIYDRVLARDDLSYALNNRFHSLKGQACELLKDYEKARESYYQVINRENLKKGEEPNEWYWYTECGFRLVKLLEEEKRWVSALRILRKLSLSGSPRAKEAGERFKSLQLEHQVWDLE